MNTISKKMCGAVLGLVMLFGAAFSASAATGANRTAAMNAGPVAVVGVGFGFPHHRRYWYYRHHHRYYYWR
jgi:hypothetical protein